MHDKNGPGSKKVKEKNDWLSDEEAAEVAPSISTDDVVGVVEKMPAPSGNEDPWEGLENHDYW